MSTGFRFASGSCRAAAAFAVMSLSAGVGKATGPDIVIADLNLVLDEIRHTSVLDLALKLKSPAGTPARWRQAIGGQQDKHRSGRLPFRRRRIFTCQCRRHHAPGPGLVAREPLTGGSSCRRLCGRGHPARTQTARRVLRWRNL